MHETVKNVLGSLRGYVFLVVLLGVWQLVGHANSVLMPPPSQWWPAFKSIEQSGALWPATEKTLELFAESLVIGTFIGITIGIATGASHHVSRTLSPILEFCRTIPAVAIVPAAVLLFGVKTGTNIGIVVFATVWPVLLNTAGSRRALPELRLEVSRSLGFSWWTQMRKIVLPSLVPDIAVGVRVAAPICLIVVLLVDFIVGTGGLGFVLIQSEQTFAAAKAFALVAFIGILGRLITVLIDRSERLALKRWPVFVTAED